MELSFGKIITHESFHDGQLRSTKTEYSIPILISNKTQALSELMECLKLIDTKQTEQIIITIKADPKTNNIRLITKSYIIEKR
jgi:hypothetical protein